MKQCPYCGEMIDDNAKKCLYCMSWVEEVPAATQHQSQYYIYVNDRQIGPISAQKLLAKGLTPNTLVWRIGMDGWQYADTMPELSSVLEAYNQQEAVIDDEADSSFGNWILQSKVVKPLLMTACCVLIVAQMLTLAVDDYGNNTVMPDWLLNLIGFLEVFLPFALAAVLKRYRVKTPAVALGFVTLIACTLYLLMSIPSIDARDEDGIIALNWILSALACYVLACVVGIIMLRSKNARLRPFAMAMTLCGAINALLFIIFTIYAAANEESVTEESLFAGIIVILLMISRIVMYVFYMILFARELK